MEPEKRGRGRPKLSVEQKRRVVFCLRLRNCDRDVVEKAAELQGMTARGWAREIILEVAQAVVDQEEEKS